MAAKMSEVKAQYDKEANAIKDKIEHFTTAAKKIERKDQQLRDDPDGSIGDLGTTKE